MAARGSAVRVDFGWQGVSLRVPADWSLGKVDGNYKSGYARLDDSEIVRAEVEWREAPPGSARRLPIPDLVDRYLEKLNKKAAKTGTEFSVQRRSKFLKDKRWLEGSDYETFTWEADFRAYNLARACGTCGRIILVRVLEPKHDSDPALAEEVFRSLNDHGTDGRIFWCIYGMSFWTPEELTLSTHGLKSGNIQLTFEMKGHICKVQRLSMAQVLLKETSLKEWYPSFFKKELRDFDYTLREESVKDHNGLRMEGRPRSRWRQLLRPLPFVNPRPRQYADSYIWHCEESNKICVVDHLYRKKGERGHLSLALTDAYACHQKKTEADPRGHDELATGQERTAEVGEER